MGTQQSTSVQGLDFTLPSAPPLVDPPLSLVGEARSLIDIGGMAAARQAAVERLHSTQEQLEDSEGDTPGEADSEEDAQRALDQLKSQWQALSAEVTGWDERLADLQRWEEGFVYLPELPLGATSVFVPGTAPAISNALQAALKAAGSNQDLFYWFDPFVAVALDARSMFGWPATDLRSRAMRAMRGLLAHEPWQVEYEFWTGAKVPTNYHLTASPNGAQSSPHRSLAYAFPLPTPVPGSVLGVAESLSNSLAKLDQAIANSDAGVGMIHATPFVVQKWMEVYSFIRDPSGHVRTVNNNLIVPGYGYPGTGPDQADRTVTDGVLNSTTTVTSATAAFTTADIGRPISDEDGEIPAGAVIVSVTNATTVVISAAATASESSAHITVLGSGGNATASSQQWAYATEMVYTLKGDVHTYPADIREGSPLLQTNDAEVRAERSWATITNRLLRAAVLVDTTTT